MSLSVCLLNALIAPTAVCVYTTDTYIRRQLQLQLYRRELACSIHDSREAQLVICLQTSTSKYIYASAEATRLPQFYRVSLIMNMVTCQSDF